MRSCITVLVRVGPGAVLAKGVKMAVLRLVALLSLALPIAHSASCTYPYGYDEYYGKYYKVKTKFELQRE